MNIDPLADFAPELTPYRYSANNPVFFNDPDGMWEFVWNKDSETISLVKTNKNDNWKTFKNNTNLTKSQLKEMFGKN